MSGIHAGLLYAAAAAIVAAVTVAVLLRRSACDSMPLPDGARERDARTGSGPSVAVAPLAAASGAELH